MLVSAYNAWLARAPAYTLCSIGPAQHAAAPSSRRGHVAQLATPSSMWRCYRTGDAGFVRCYEELLGQPVAIQQVVVGTPTALPGSMITHALLVILSAAPAVAVQIELPP